MEPAVAAPDAAEVFQVHLLDMGAYKYGDCILCRIGPKVILVDGGHLGDQKRRHPDHASIPEQLEAILGKRSPWKVDLLVITHAHSDHIGCLPSLVKSGLLTAAWVLAADEKLGWGEVEGADAPGLSEAPEPVRQAFALLREEPPVFASREELEAFASDAASLRANYTAMLDRLKAQGARVVRYGRDSTAALLRAFKSSGLEILGPSRKHLAACALQIASLGRDAVDLLSSRLEQDSSLDAADLCQELREGWGESADAGGEWSSVGAAINDQSLVLSFESGGRKILLTGDMQFGGPGVQGLDGAMAALRETIAAQGPYELVKLAHHGARNGADPAFLEQSGAHLFLVSGGYGSSKHPHRSTLESLQALPDAIWYRTDRNGLVSVDLAPEDLEVGWERGEPNEKELNPDARDFLEEEEETEEPAGSRAPSEGTARPRVTQTVTAGPDGFVEVIVRIPQRRTKVVLTIEVEPPEEAKAASRPGPREGGWTDAERPSPPASIRGGGGSRTTLRIGGGREDLPPLLFATDPEALKDNLGREEARGICKALESSGHAAVFRNFRRMDSSKAAVEIRKALDPKTVQGIVLVGGYDVIPPDSVDVLSATHRRAVDPRYDPDGFLVWCDDFYGDLDGDDLPEIPVSRIPDGRYAPLLRTALAAPLVRPPRRRAGLRNFKRPFAEEVFAGLPGDARLLVSHPATPQSIDPDYFSSDVIYLMLHGQSSNGRRFLGANGAEELIDAFDGRNIRPCPGAVVFTGCCWGALLVETTAWTHEPGKELAPRAPEASLALGFLASGANAFVGCTGVHYSPTIKPYNYASGPFHRAFWKHLTSGLRPAEALLATKRSYLQGMPYPNPIPGEDPGAAAAAVEKKLLAQFTCLGLGW
ncbi:MAG TPA: MBL fold metallo-hydrolase [Thermoanaerobaculia bacterium]|nr:MBL fold metallo-hydrolase [Thermoanaerobaculia bacterium]